MNDTPPLNITAVLATEEISSATSTSQSNAVKKDVGLHQIIILSDYSSLIRVQRVTAYVLRFVYNCRHPQTSMLGVLSSAEQRKANLQWILDTQQQVFSHEIETSNPNQDDHPLCANFVCL